MFTRTIAAATLTASAVLLLAPSGVGAAPHHSPRPLARADATKPSFVEFETPLGNIYVELLPADAPKTVTNFLSYVTSGKYAKTFISRSVPGFVVQGGGYSFTHDKVEVIPEGKVVVNEYKLSNAAYTLAMAKGTAVNSATDQWYFNETNNTDLDKEDGGYTVFGKIAAFGSIPASASIDVLKKVSDAKIVDIGSPFTTIPVINYKSGKDVTQKNLVMVNIKVVTPTS
jgi:cyclophilin family peptidyl-prolyl cis-trans isomerase